MAQLRVRLCTCRHTVSPHVCAHIKISAAYSSRACNIAVTRRGGPGRAARTAQSHTCNNCTEVVMACTVDTESYRCSGTAVRRTTSMSSDASVRERNGRRRAIPRERCAPPPIIGRGAVPMTPSVVDAWRRAGGRRRRRRRKRAELSTPSPSAAPWRGSGCR